jgi:hypothetical protein
MLKFSSGMSETFFFRHLCELVLRHQMRVSNYFVNSFYSVCSNGPEVNECGLHYCTYAVVMVEISLTEVFCTVYRRRPHRPSTISKCRVHVHTGDSNSCPPE